MIIIGLVLAAGIGFTVYKVSQTKSNKSRPASSQSSGSVTAKKTTCSFDGQNVEVPRQSADGAFTSAVTDINNIAVISPGKFVGDERYTYLEIKNDQSIPVYAPADGALVKIAYKTRVDVPAGMSAADYDLAFLVDCKTMYSLTHITAPSADIAAVSPVTEPVKITKGTPIDEQSAKPKSNVIVKAGQQIGTTTGTPTAHNWDFGVFIDQAATCPYDRFTEPIRSSWLALLGNAAIDPTKPIAGTSCEVSGNY